MTAQTPPATPVTSPADTPASAATAPAARGGASSIGGSLPPHILVVDDDTRLRRLLTRYLGEQGWLVSAAEDARDARAWLARLRFDLVVLDVMMPGEDGLSLCRWISRERAAGDEPSEPVLLLTARGEASDRINGLEAGADDYLVKPFEPRELMLRIASILRRTRTNLAGETDQPVRLGRWMFDPVRGELQDSTGEGDSGSAPQRISLTAVEATLLRTLARSPHETLTRETLAEACGLQGNLRTIDVQVTRLRRKIEDDPRTPRCLHTVRGEGYILRPD